MDRAYVQKLLDNARKRDTMIVHLPACGQDIELYTSLNRDQQLRVLAAAGDDEDSSIRRLVGILRFTLVDDDRKLLLNSFDEAARFVNGLDAEDMGVLIEELIDITKGPAEGEQAEAGKANRQQRRARRR